MTPRALTRVFLCHSAADKPAVRALYRRLVDDGFAPWLDEEDLAAGEKWELAIDRAVRNADYVVACLSDTATTTAGYVQKEIKLALDVADLQPEGEIYVIPVRLEPCGVPDRLRHLHWVDLFNDDGYRRLTDSLRITRPARSLGHRRPDPAYAEELERLLKDVTPEQAKIIDDAKLNLPVRQHREDADTVVRLGIWGAPRSGKTTLLAALPIAALQSSHDSGRFVVSGVGQVSSAILSEGVQRLTRGRFPPPTDSSGSVTWLFHGFHNGVDLGSVRGPRRLRPRRAAQPIDFVAELHDSPGKHYRDGAIDPVAVDDLALSSGLVYLFDPVLGAHEDLRSFDFFYAALLRVAARVRDEGRMYRGRLPHHVSVLVTKLDDPQFFNSAVRAGWVNQGAEGTRLPYVPIAQGPAFFDWVCAEREGGTAKLLRDALRSFFHAERIEYFACSAIGFRLNPNDVFDYTDYINVEAIGGETRIRSMVRPLNIIEPFVRLERRIRLERPAASR